MWEVLFVCLFLLCLFVPHPHAGCNSYWESNQCISRPEPYPSISINSPLTQVTISCFKHLNVLIISFEICLHLIYSPQIGRDVCKCISDHVSLRNTTFQWLHIALKVWSKIQGRSTKFYIINPLPTCLHLLILFLYTFMLNSWNIILSPASNPSYMFVPLLGMFCFVLFLLCV